MQTLRDWLAAEDFGLAMSSGFFSFFAHAGMLSALDEEGLRPTSLSGSSAGALVAGLYGAGVSCEVICQELSALSREDFWDPRPGLGLLGGRLFRDKLDALLPVKNFSDCTIPVSISAYDLIRHKTQVLDEGDLASAIHASCAFPLLFHPVRRERCLLSDGGIRDRPGLHAKPAEARTFYHHILSRSPWRPGALGLAIPEYPGMLSLCIDKLPRANPFHLDRGRKAMELAREATRRALQMPVTQLERGALHVEA